MFRHVILWTLKNDISDTNEVCKNAKKALESLQGKIDGLISIDLHIDSKGTSNCSMMLDSLFIDEKSYLAYRTNPYHVSAADTFVRPYTDTRLCFDYDEKA